MCALCVYASGLSVLKGTVPSHGKDLLRLDEVFNLLQRIGVQLEVRSDGVIIQGLQELNANEVLFDAREDQRLIVFAALLKWMGFNLKIENAKIIQKNFPEYFQLVKEFL